MPGRLQKLSIVACTVVAWSASAGTIETLDHQKLEGRITLTENGGLSIVSAEGLRQEISLEQVRVARFQNSRFDSDALPKGWRAEEIGDVLGSSFEQDRTLTLKVSGKMPTDSKSQTAHYAFRLLRGDGGISTRIESIHLSGVSLAGLMLRENLDLAGGFALLGVTAEKQLRLTWREGGWKEMNKLDLGPVTLPIWLRLARNQDKDLVIAWRSKDGLAWERAGQAKLSVKTEPFPSNSTHYKPRLWVGAAITGPGSDAVSTVRFDHYSITGKGLMGEYYASDDFTNPKFARLDTKLDMNWDHTSPAADIAPEHFSARWIGHLEPRFSEPYRFCLDAPEGTRLWLNGEELSRVAWSGKPSAGLGNERMLRAGEKCDLRVEFKKGEKGGRLRLGWSSPSQTLEVIPAHQLSYLFNSQTPEEEKATAPLLTKGIWLRNGSFLAGEIISSDGSSSQVNFAGQKEFNIFNQKITRVIFRSSRRAIPFEVAAGHTGLFLQNGDFLESEFEGLKQKTLRMTSLLFGRRTFNLEHPEVVALVLNSPAAETDGLQLKLLDGSVLKAKSFAAAPGQWIVHDELLGSISIPEKEIVELRNTRSTVTADRAKQ
jgi:hypothetical protein